MATVRPFRGVHFDPLRVSDAGLVTCPPYDVISPDDRTRLYDRHPYNVVRIVSGRDEPGDDETDNRYSRASGFFKSWMWEGVLRQEEPALYVYRQAFSDPSGRFRRVWGMLATISLDDEILAHEQTMPGPKADRLNLMRSIPANISPIYALYHESCAGPISAELPDLTHHSPVADFSDDEDTRHTVWAVYDQAFHEQVAKALATCPLLIADGHHRFETAKAYRAEVGEQASSIMALLVDAGVQPVCILPYHRVVVRAGLDDPMPVLRANFSVEEVSGDPEKLGLQLWDDPRPGVFIAFVGDTAYRLVANETLPDDIPAGILKRLALEPLGARFAEDALEFTPHASLVARRASEGALCGFLMQPVDVARVWDLALTGAQMPEKSTYFHPKPRDGIVMRLLEPEG